MKLLDEIVDLLSDDRASLSSALFKTKVLLRTIGEGELVGWLNDEINGYGDANFVPPYRKLTTRVLGNISNGWQIVQRAYPVPLSGTPRQFQEFMGTQNLTHALSVLERMAEEDDKKVHLSYTLDPTVYEPLGGVLNEGFQFERVWAQVELSQVRQLLIQVRSRLLDFILELKDKIGDTVSDNEAKLAAAKHDVPSIFAGAVFGDHATIQVGDNNRQKVVNNIAKGNKQSLGEELRRHGVDEEDISELEIAINADPVVLTAPGQFGPGVRNWMKRMVGKAIDTAWAIEVGMASSLLTTALQRYYGV
ncbi:response regulator receiver protein [Massilia atriviolacea]|uniref:Response regulator receiver protein n=1 Tax=Massilia atriviolacea TaxID=2495579 RepID=A0A430HDH9_9BURK|nr:response regulator receiver protein [Massilia atriviolacea]RSZ55595.1 response regulator receiver protein [Massilia atriviolacea]